MSRGQMRWGRAGIRFSDLPDKARARLRDWLTENAGAPSWKAPRWVVQESAFRNSMSSRADARGGVALSLETGSQTGESESASTTVQYEFKSLGADVNVGLTLIASRACSITRGTGAAVALVGESGMTCRAVAGSNVPPLGTEIDPTSGFTGECVRLGLLALRRFGIRREDRRRGLPLSGNSVHSCCPGAL